MCLKGFADMIETRWDEIGENFEALEQKAIAWAANKVEKIAGGGTVPMEVGAAMETDNGMFGTEEYMEGAVHEHTRCYECGGFGHMGRECESKGGGKVGGKTGWNAKGKGGGKTGGKVAGAG